LLLACAVAADARIAKNLSRAVARRAFNRLVFVNYAGPITTWTKWRGIKVGVHGWPNSADVNKLRRFKIPDARSRVCPEAYRVPVSWGVSGSRRQRSDEIHLPDAGDLRALGGGSLLGDRLMIF
jgi:hypothetical protein